MPADRIGHEGTKDTKYRDRGKLIAHHLNELCTSAIGAAIEVHKFLGPGLIEGAYEHALAIELASRGIAFERQFALPIVYKGTVVAEQRLDFLVEGQLVLELKAVESLHAVHTAQLLSYLRTGAFQVGLLLNFNVALLREGVRRLLLDV